MGIFWALSMMFTIRQVVSYFMIAVYFSVPCNWATGIYGFITVLITGTDWSDYETVLGVMALGIWIAVTFVWQFYMVPPVTVWYRMALEAVNHNDYTKKGLNDI